MRRATWALFLVMACEADEPAVPGDESTSAPSGDTSSTTNAPTTSSSAGEASAGESSAGASSEGESSEGESSAGSTGSASDVPPIGSAALRPWLDAREYSEWIAESAPHSSTGPHFGAVRTFVNTALFDSLSSSGDPHPIDAAAVKELYGDGDEVVGWSVMVKVADGSGGDSWYWLEYYRGSTYADGVGDSLCTGCHGDGTDHVLSPFPLQ